MKLDRDDLKVLEDVTFAAADLNEHPSLARVRITGTSTGLALEATDSYIWTFRTLAVAEAEAFAGQAIIVPADLLRRAAKAARRNAESLVLADIDDGGITLTWGPGGATITVSAFMDETWRGDEKAAQEAIGRPAAVLDSITLAPKFLMKAARSLGLPDAYTTGVSLEFGGLHAPVKLTVRETSDYSYVMPIKRVDVHYQEGPSA